MSASQSKPKSKSRIMTCQAITKDGKACTRLALKGEQHCWQHSSSFLRKLRNGIITGGLAGIVTLTVLILNLDKIIERIVDILNPSTRADNLYYVFLVDASSRMADNFDGDKTKWDAVQDAALRELLPGLTPGANYGLLMLGGNTSPGNATCDSIAMSAPLRRRNRDTVDNLIRNQQADGEAPLTSAIDLVSEELFRLPNDSEKRLELFVFLGGGDSCSDNSLIPLLSFLRNSAKLLSETHVDIFFLSNEPVDEDVIRRIEETEREVKNVKVKITRNTAELTEAVRESYQQAQTRAREVEPTAVAVQETVVAQNFPPMEQIPTESLRNNPPERATQRPIANTPVLTIPVTPSSGPPTVTASLTPSPTRTPIPTIQIPTTAIPPTPIPTTEIPPEEFPTEAPPTLVPPTFPATLPAHVSDDLPLQTDVFSPGCPLITDSQVFAQFYQSQAFISTELVNNGRTDKGLRLDFSNISYQGSNYAGWEVWLTPNENTGIDLSQYSSLVFYIRGRDGGEEPNVYLMMPITDNYWRYWKDVEQVVRVSQTWQQVVIPLGHFTTGQGDHQQVDLHNIQRIQILFEWYPEPRSGRIFIDDLCVE